VEGREILLCDDPQRFADAACAVLTDPDSYAGYGSAGRQLIMECYTWDAIAKVMDRLWREAGA
jgi:glycosyltransferase involved in cell wall biosynthesis